MFCIMGVCLHFEIDQQLLESPYLFHPYVTLKNCVRNTNNSQKQFGIISQNPYKSIQNKFSDNSNLLPKPQNLI